MEFFAGGLIVIGLALPVILILGILVILALRHDDDPDANRAPAIYGAVIAFLAILTILFASTGVVGALLETSSGHTHGDGGSYSRVEMSGPMMDGDDMYQGGMNRRLVRYSDDDDGAAVSDAVGLLIAGLAAAALLAVHRRLFARRFTVAGAAARVHRAYLLIMCFVVAIVAVTAAAMTLNFLYQLIFSGAANVENRADVARDLIPAAVLGLGAGWIWRWHWSELGLDLGGGAPSTAEPTDVP
jgi:hypothetical protein